MDRVNPAYIPRNHLVEEALAAARNGDLEQVTSLLEAVTAPYDEQPARARYAEPAPAGFTESYLTYCGT
jgi:serine/tyrosine/threonine adenylyltransferase